MNKRLFLSAAALCSAIVYAAFIDSSEKPRSMPEKTSETVILPGPKYSSVTSVEEALSKRRSVRDFSDRPLSVTDVSQLLWAAQGITGSSALRTTPSAGALYPLELYLVAGNVNGLPPGIYKYVPRGHELLNVVKGDKRADLCDAAIGQSSVRRAAAAIVLSAIYERTTAKYGERGVRYVHMESGHAAQNVYLEAASLRLGTVVIGAFSDDKVKRLLKMADREWPLYIMPVGK